MRVIAGRFRGRQLVSFQAGHIRPTTDRVKESIFNKLQMQTADARVLDLFSGTGNLSIEALSRGAAHVTAVELSKKSLQILKKNLDSLQIQKHEIEVIGDDVFRFLKRYEGPPFDIILVDPPFTEKLADQVLGVISELAERLLHAETVLMIESSKHEVVQDHYQRLERFDVRDYGDKLVSYFQLKGG